MLELSPTVAPIRQLIDKRLLTPKNAVRAHKILNDQLITLWRAGYVNLEPKPSLAEMETGKADPQESADKAAAAASTKPAGITLDLGQRQASSSPPKRKPSAPSEPNHDKDKAQEPRPLYQPEFAHPTELLPNLAKLRGVHPLYGMFLMNHLGIADRNERLQAMESLLELPRSLGRAVRVPNYEALPPGPLALGRLDEQLLKLGLATAEELGATPPDEDEDDKRGGWFDEERVYVLSLAQKLHRLFQHDFPSVHDVRIWPVWIAGELMEYGGDFNKYITSNKLQSQEGMIFRHLLRLVLLIDELAQLCPPDIEANEWQAELGEIADQIESACRSVDERGTEQWLQVGKKEPSDG
ncbi:MAG: hypothetical protein P8J33_16255 [Pirellulaceae bacterium]|nr:hypothetical protein [Pirellulaceae bacterium]